MSQPIPSHLLANNSRIPLYSTNKLNTSCDCYLMNNFVFYYLCCTRQYCKMNSEKNSKMNVIVLLRLEATDLVF